MKCSLYILRLHLTMDNPNTGNFDNDDSSSMGSYNSSSSSPPRSGNLGAAFWEKTRSISTNAKKYMTSKGPREMITTSVENVSLLLSSEDRRTNNVLCWGGPSLPFGTDDVVLHYCSRTTDDDLVMGLPL